VSPSPGPEFGEYPAHLPAVVAVPGKRLWLHALLAALTFLTTSFMGARLAENFAQNVPAFQDDGVSSLMRMAAQPALLLGGLPFSLTLMTILMAHEMGHYLACRFYRIDASLPYFLPAPTLMGTLGAFIRLRSAVYTRRALFDVGVAGPLAGFAFLVPAFIIGVAYAKVLPEIAVREDHYSFGVPILERLLHWLLFPGTPSADIYIHPIGRAAWVGVLATALYLLPIGQLDGGHMLYAFFGERCRILWRLAVAALIPMGFLYSVTWLFWAVFLAIFALRHPPLFDQEPMGSGRVKLAVFSIAVFVLCFMPVPVDIPIAR
jgi:membrane-associated protease RseP (regulator of RpoE activity)